MVRTPFIVVALAVSTAAGCTRASSSTTSSEPPGTTAARAVVDDAPPVAASTIEATAPTGGSTVESAAPRAPDVSEAQHTLLGFVFGNGPAGTAPDPHVNDDPDACPLVRDELAQSALGSDTHLPIDRVALSYGERSGTGFWECQWSDGTTTIRAHASWSPADGRLDVSVDGDLDAERRQRLEAAVRDALDPAGTPQAADVCTWIDLRALATAGSGSPIARADETSEMNRWSCVWEFDDATLSLEFLRLEPGFRSVEAELGRLRERGLDLDVVPGHRGAFTTPGAWYGETPLGHYGVAGVELARHEATQIESAVMIDLVQRLLDDAVAADPWRTD